MPQLRSLLISLRRKMSESIGSDRFSRPSLGGIEDLLDGLFDQPGTFVECGAYDGFIQSNTYWLERFRGWSGLLIEPIPKMAALARRQRKRSTVVEAALSSPDMAGTTLNMTYAGLMTLGDQAMGGDDEDALHIRSAVEVQHGIVPFSFQVKVLTLSEVIDTHLPNGAIDFLSLDVEGMEPLVLQGLDFRRHRPRVLLVELNRPDEVGRILTRAGYADLGMPTDRDGLFIDQRASV